MRERIAEATRTLYARHAAVLGLDPWKPGGWRNDPPTAKQRKTLMNIAASDLGGFTPEDVELIRGVASHSEAAKGAFADATTVAIAMYRRNQAGAGLAPAPRLPAPAVDASPDALRVALVRLVLDADAATLDAMRRAVQR